MITLSLADLVPFAVLVLVLLSLIDRQSLLQEMKRTRRDVKELRQALNMQGKPTKRGTIPPWMRQRVIERCKHQCQYCGGYGDSANGPDGLPWHVDHVVAVSKGGPTTQSNLTLACEACNLSKNAISAAEFNGKAVDVEPVYDDDSSLVGFDRTDDDVLLSDDSAEAQEPLGTQTVATTNPQVVAVDTTGDAAMQVALRTPTRRAPATPAEVAWVRAKWELSGHHKTPTIRTVWLTKDGKTAALLDAFLPEQGLL